jgi:hypothetical protein
MALISDRKYTIMVAENGDTATIKAALGNLINPHENDNECVYALNDMMDEVLDLKKGESMYFQPNRDNKLAKGIITRSN